jgi:hypothetical protein
MAAPNPATGVGWSTTSPGIGEPHGNDYLEHQETKLALSLRLVKEHVAFSTSTAGGEHKPGSAISYFGDFSASAAGDALPTRRPDAAAPWQDGQTPAGTALTSADYGRLAYDTDAVFGGVLWVYLAAGWTKVGYMDILTAQTIAGVKTFNSFPVIATAAHPPTTDYQLADKKYVDDAIVTAVPAYAGGQSYVLGGGLIMKMGRLTLAGNPGSGSVSFTNAFPTALISLQATQYYDGVSSNPNTLHNVTTYSVSAAGFSAGTGANSTDAKIDWIAIGH